MGALERIVILLALAVIGVNVAILATRSDDSSSDPVDDPFAAQERTGAVPSCRDTTIPESPPRPVVCRTSSATLVIASQDDDVLVGPTRVRLHSARIEGTLLTLRLGLRNETDERRSLPGPDDQLYVTLGPHRIEPRGIDSPRVGARQSADLGVTFRLTARQATDLRAAGRRAELGVRSLRREAEDRVGVIRFRARSG